MAKRVLMVVGSMRKESFNMQLAKRAEKMIGDRAEVRYLEYADLPYMNQDIEFPAPEQVARVRKEVGEADGIWFVTPEYNFSYPGVLKNLLDWLSRPLTPGDFQGGTAISGKKVTISGAAGKSAAGGSRKKLRELLGFMKVVLAENETGVSMGREDFQTNRLTLSEEAEQSLQKQTEEFLEMIGECGYEGKKET